MSHSDQELAARWPLAQAFGWHLVSHNGFISLVPPQHFPCKRWAAGWVGMNFMGQRVLVPSWFWEDDVLKTGTSVIQLL